MNTSANPCLRDDLSFIEQVYRGERSYVVKDLTAQRYFRFGATEVRVMRAFDGRHTPTEIAVLLGEQGLRVGADVIERFARQLAGAGFFERTMRERTTLQMERVRAERRQRRRPSLFRGEILRMRWSFGDPDTLLAHVLPGIAWMFTPAFLALSVVLFGTYFLVVGERLPEYLSALHAMLAPLTIGHVIVIAATGFSVIVIHELGHGFTCKYFGGEVHELGFMLLYFQPAFYCNVTDAWSFPDRRARLWVTAAGSWIQMVVAAIAALVWWAAAPGTLVAEICVAAMLIGGAWTLVTNANPLLPLDGYFALTDWLEIPNLRQRALEHFGWWIESKVFRLGRPEPTVTARERRVFLLYGSLAAIYSALTLLVFAAFLFRSAGRVLGGVGALLTVATLAVVMRRFLVSWSRRLVMALRVHRMSLRRRLRSRTAIILAAVVVIVGLAMPRPLTSTGTFVVRPVTARTITPEDSDVVAEVFATQGTRLVAGAPVLRLVDYANARDLAQTSRTADSLAVAERAARASDRIADAEALEASRRASDAQRVALARRASRLVLRAPIAGVIANVRPEALIGREVLPGDSLLAVVALDTVEVRISLTGAGAARVRPGQMVRLIGYADPAATRSARVLTVSTAGLRSGNGPTLIEARVRMPSDSAWRPGIRGEASVELERSTLAAVLWWKLCQRVRTDLWL